MDRQLIAMQIELGNAYDAIVKWEHIYKKDVDIAFGERDRVQELLVQSNTALEALRTRHAEVVEKAFREGALMVIDCPFTSEDIDKAWLASSAKATLEDDDE